MKHGAWLKTFLRALALVFGLWSLLAADPVLDQLTLKDGRVIQGRVVGETDSQVDIAVGGVTRAYDRDFIDKLDYGGEDAVPRVPSGPDAGPPLPPQGDALAADLSARYQVPESSVFWVRRQGLPDSDLEPVFEIASEAGVPLRAVVGLRVRGWSWRDIRAHYDLLRSPEAPEAVVVVAPPPPLILRILLFPLFIFGFHWR